MVRAEKVCGWFEAKKNIKIIIPLEMRCFLFFFYCQVSQSVSAIGKQPGHSLLLLSGTSDLFPLCFNFLLSEFGCLGRGDLAGSRDDTAEGVMMGECRRFRAG